jgi:hypothetical protein
MMNRLKISQKRYGKCLVSQLIKGYKESPFVTSIYSDVLWFVYPAFAK